MVSPMPTGADAAAPLLAPGDGLLASPSPLAFSFPSPGVGRTPGAHVVQEGRLSLEMFNLAAEAGLAGQPGAAMDLLAPLHSAALARATAAGALKGGCHRDEKIRGSSFNAPSPRRDAHARPPPAPAGSAIPHPNPPTGNQQPKLTPPALVTATTEQLNAKASLAPAPHPQLSLDVITLLN